MRRHHHVTLALLLAVLAGSACAQKLAPGLWEHSFTMKSPAGSTDATTARMQVDSMHKGQPMRTEMQQAGRWLAADCGDVKPRP
jgi:hypothetical protein